MNLFDISKNNWGGEDMSNTKKMKLFCIPNAGGSAVIYLKWKKYLDDFIELFPIELAGRGSMFKSPFYKSLEEAVDDVYRIVESNIGESHYAIFGHSMGSEIAYELCKKIHNSGNEMPRHVFLSGRYPPHICKKGKMMHQLSDKELLHEIISYGGTSEELLENQDVVDYFLEIIRADYRIIENHRHVEDNFMFPEDITVLRGKDDSLVDFSDLEEWKQYASKNCYIKEFNGGHFYMNEHLEEVTSLINTTLLSISRK